MKLSTKKILEFTIPVAPITKKNSPRLLDYGVKCRCCGRRQYTRPMPSKQYVKYEKECGRYMPTFEESIDEPVEVTAIFYMPTRRTVDLTNLLEALDDVLVKYGIVKDDNCKIIYSHDGSRVMYDKAKPRTVVRICRYI